VFVSSLALAVFLPLGSGAQRGRPELQDAASWRLRYVDLRVTLLPPVHALVGSARLVLGTTGSSALDATIDLSDSMRVDSVRVWRGDSVSTAGFARVRDQLRVPLAALPCARERQCAITIWYHGSPLRRAVAFDEHRGIVRVASYGLPNSAREWWPTLDRPSEKADSADIWITADSALVAASNGRRVERAANGDGTATTHWAVRLPVYSDVISFAVADYVELPGTFISAGGRTVPLAFFAFPEDSAAARVDFAVVEGILRFLESRLGSYPFASEKYGIAEFSRPSFREHQTLPSLGSRFITGRHEADEIIAHEAAHQWFGNSVSVDTWQDIWMNESFSQYMAWQWVRSARGDSAFWAGVAQAQTAAYTGALARADSGGFSTMFGPVTFQKGPLVLLMLEDLLGEPRMRAALARYVRGLAYRHGSPRAFQREAERVYGKSLDWFFAQWVDGAAVPELNMTWSVRSARGAHPRIWARIRQVQPGPPFRLPITILVAHETGPPTVHTEWVASQAAEFSFPAGGAVRGALLDVTRILAHATPSVRLPDEP
jgi:aminopeptidase N